MMLALVTGATGFVGNQLVLELRARGWRVICISRRAVSSTDKGISTLQADLLDLNSLLLALDRVGPIDALFHIAAMLPQSGPVAQSTYLQANAGATLNMLDIASRLNVGSFVYTSSLSILGKPVLLPITEHHAVNPGHAYALSKLCGELACEMARRQGNRVASLRMSSPYGPGMQGGSVLAQFVKKTLNADAIAWYGSGERSQDFVHVTDVVQACLLASSTSNPGVFNIGAGVQTSMKELAELVIALVPESGARASAAGVADPQDDVRWDVDITKARELLGYTPTVRLESGVMQLIDSMRANRALTTWWS